MKFHEVYPLVCLFGPEHGMYGKDGAGEDVDDVAPVSYTHLDVYKRQTWQFTGWTAIIYLAAITSISPDLFEAAEMDGACLLYTSPSWLSGFYDDGCTRVHAKPHGRPGRRGDARLHGGGSLLL